VQALEPSLPAPDLAQDLAAGLCHTHPPVTAAPWPRPPCKSGGVCRCDQTPALQSW
jgi:hypothetical protein